MEDNRQRAVELLWQLVELDKARDLEYVALLAEKKIYLNGESAISFHLKNLIELINKI